MQRPVIINLLLFVAAAASPKDSLINEIRFAAGTQSTPPSQTAPKCAVKVRRTDAKGQVVEECLSRDDAQVQPEPAPAPKALNCTIEGQVTDAKGQPVEGAEVSAVARTGSRAFTDVGGNYVLNVAEGTYIAFARKDGYATSRFRRLLMVNGGKERVDLTLYGESTISGSVTDSHGKPIPRANVQLWARSFRNLGPEYTPVGGGLADDTGHYVAHNLQAGGDIYVGAHPPRIEPVPADAKRKPARTGFPIAIYPGADSFEYARPIHLRAGEARENVDLIAREVPTFCLRATIATAAAHREKSHVAVTVSQLAGGWSFGVGGGNVVPGRAFQFCGLAADVEHELMAFDWGSDSKVDGLTRVRFFATPEAVEKGEMDLGMLVPAAGAPLHVSISIENPQPGELVSKATVVTMLPRNRNGFINDSSSAESTGDGGFTFANVLPDEHWLSIFNFGAGYYVKSAQDSRHDLLSEPWQPGSGDVHVVLASDGASVAGRVVDADNKPVPDALVILLPKDLHPGERGRARIVSEPGDQNGQFRFRTAIIPGDYRLLALSGAIQGDVEDPEALTPYLSRAIDLVLTPKDRHFVVLTAQSLDR